MIQREVVSDKKSVCLKEKTLFDEKGVFTPFIHSGIIETDRKKAKNNP